MLKKTNTIEMLGNEKRIYRFHYDPNAPEGEVFDMLNKMKDYMLKHMEIQQRLKSEAEQKK